MHYDIQGPPRPRRRQARRHSDGQEHSSQAEPQVQRRLAAGVRPAFARNSGGSIRITILEQPRGDRLPKMSASACDTHCTLLSRRATTRAQIAAAAPEPRSLTPARARGPAIAHGRHFLRPRQGAGTVGRGGGPGRCSGFNRQPQGWITAWSPRSSLRRSWSPALGRAGRPGGRACHRAGHGVGARCPDVLRPRQKRGSSAGPPVI